MGAAVVVVILALAVTVAIGIARTAASPVQAVTVSDGTADAAAPDGQSRPRVHVHVAGAVAAPGLYVLDEHARVFDAIAAAGGFVPEADRAAVNLARELSDGEQLHVPLVGEEPPAADPAADDGRIDLNTADAAALETLPRIGPALAARILEWREANGRFTSVDDLLAVAGIGEKMLEAMRDLVRV